MRPLYAARRPADTGDAAKQSGASAPSLARRRRRSFAPRAWPPGLALAQLRGGRKRRADVGERMSVQRRRARRATDGAAVRRT
jgi:hypothetical protein